MPAWCCSALWAKRVLAKVHPSSILRAPDDETRQRELDAMVADLTAVRAALSQPRRRAHARVACGWVAGTSFRWGEASVSAA